MVDIIHTDVLGQVIPVGSMVLYGSGSGRGNYAGFKPRKVVALTPKMIRIEDGGKNTKIVDPYNCVVIDKLLKEKNDE